VALVGDQAVALVVPEHDLQALAKWRAPWEPVRFLWTGFAYQLYRRAPWPVGHDGADDFALCARLSPDLARLRLVEPCLYRIALDFDGRLHVAEAVGLLVALAVGLRCLWAALCCIVQQRRRRAKPGSDDE